MKALPVKLVYGEGYMPCAIEEATHVTLNIPGPTGRLSLPVIQHGTRAGTGCWTWNGSTDAPTLRPSVLTQGHKFRCHSWINDGQAQFLDDCSHELANTTVDLLDVDALDTCPACRARHAPVDELIEALEDLMDWQVKNVALWHNRAYDRAHRAIKKHRAALQSTAPQTKGQP